MRRVAKGLVRHVLQVARPFTVAVPAWAASSKADAVATFLAQHNTGVVGHGADEPVSTLTSKPGPQGVGRRIYVDVVNKPDLGIKQTLLYEGKEFGTFPHVVVINDPTNQYASNRNICFSKFKQNVAAPGGDLTEVGLPEITVTE